MEGQKVPVPLFLSPFAPVTPLVTPASSLKGVYSESEY